MSHQITPSNLFNMIAKLFPRILISSLALFFILAPCVHKVHAQDAAPAAAAPSESTVMQKETFWQTVKNGGIIMIPLTLISVWCLTLIIEGFIRIRLVNFAPVDVVRQLKQAFSEENYQQAWRVCKSRSSFLTNTLRRGLERIGRGRVACETALNEYTLKESLLYRTRISYLSTIGVVSPMVGLLGTVFGMINAFKTLGKSGLADPSQLAAAIGEVLIATATGLLVAIPAFFMYYFFRNHLQRIITLAEDVIHQLMADVKYDELQGLRIGEEMEAQLAGMGTTPSGAPLPRFNSPQNVMGARVSQLVSAGAAACPQCNSPIVQGAPNCGACGTELQWG
jgi:biopolymer transport protein ExbB